MLQRAVAWYTSQPAPEPDSPAATRRYAAALHAAGEWQFAAELYSRLLIATPDDVDLIRAGASGYALSLHLADA